MRYAHLEVRAGILRPDGKAHRSQNIQRIAGFRFLCANRLGCGSGGAGEESFGDILVSGRVLSCPDLARSLVPSTQKNVTEKLVVLGIRKTSNRGTSPRRVSSFLSAIEASVTNLCKP